MKPATFAIFADIGNAGRKSFARRTKAHGSTTDAHRTRRLTQSHDRLRGFGATAPNKSGDTNNLTGSNRERNPSRTPNRAEFNKFDRRSRRLVTLALRRVDRTKISSDHCRGERAFVQFAANEFLHQPSVAQDACSIGDSDDFIEVM